MPIAFEIQQGLPCVFTNLPNLTCLLSPLSMRRSAKSEEVNLWKVSEKS